LDRYHVPLGTTAQPRADSNAIEISYTGTLIGGGPAFLTMVPGRSGRGLDVVRMTPGTTVVDTLLGTEADETYAVASPDGRWFAYTSDHSGRAELYVRSLTGSNALLQVSNEGASEPMWSRNANEIFYRSGTNLVGARLSLAGEPGVIDRKILFDVSQYDAAGPHSGYDVSPDGSWFVFARRGDASHIVVLQNVAELARRAARGGTTPP
jgi:serine/threonine-protein kinase